MHAEESWREPFHSLEKRIERLENLLAGEATGLEPDSHSGVTPQRTDASDTPTVSPSPAPGAQPSRAVNAPSPMAPPVAPPPVVRPRVQAFSPKAVVPQVSVASARSELSPIPQPANRADPRERRSLEVMIGRNWMAWIGSIIVVAAVGFFIKLAYDQGWWGAMSPLTRCCLAAGFGFVLIGTGEIALRRFGRAVSVALFAAGLGTLYLTSFATFQFFGLLSEGGAFALLALTALLGVGISVRGRMLTIGSLSIVCGYITPVLLPGTQTFAAALPMYLSMLLGIGLMLSLLMPKPFHSLRFTASVLHVALATTWLVNDGRDSVPAALTFLGVWWAMVTALAVIQAHRNQGRNSNAVLQLLFTCWFVICGSAVLMQTTTAGPDWLALFVGGVGLLSAAIAAQIGGFQSLRVLPRSAVSSLAVSMWVQSASLVIIACALRFDEAALTIAWLCSGVAGVEIGRRLRSRGIDVFGLVCLLLALLRVATLDRFFGPVGPGRQIFESLIIDRWTVIASCMAGALYLAAHRLRSGSHVWHALPSVLATTGALLVMGLWTHAASGALITFGWVLAGVALLVVSPFGRKQHYDIIGLGVLIAATGRWLLADLALHRADPAWTASAEHVVLNARFGLGLLIAVIWYFAARMAQARATRGDEGLARLQAAIQLVAILIVAIAGSFEVEHLIAGLHANDSLELPRFAVLQHGLTMLWASAAVAISLLGCMRASDATKARASIFTPVAGAIVIICALKWIVIDTLAGTNEAGLSRADVMPFLNTQVFAGAFVISAAIVLRNALGIANSLLAERLARWRSFISIAASLLLLWGLGFEIERMITIHETNFVDQASLTWPPGQLRMLWLTLATSLWASAMILIGHLRNDAYMRTCAVSLVLMAAIAWLVLDTIAWRVMRVPADVMPMFNLQAMTGIASLGAIIATNAITRKRAMLDDDDRAQRRRLVMAFRTLIGLTLLWIGSFEIDRTFEPSISNLTNAAMARQAALSCYWGVFGIALVAIGFKRSFGTCRIAGLILLGITVTKVLMVDTSELDGVYRVMSFLGTGLLLILTSAGYAKLAPKLQSTTPA